MHVQVLAKENARIDPVVLALADLIAEQPDRLLPHIHFEGDYCLACDWRRLDLKESAEVLPLTHTHIHAMQVWTCLARIWSCMHDWQSSSLEKSYCLAWCWDLQHVYMQAACCRFVCVFLLSLYERWLRPCLLVS